MRYGGIGDCLQTSSILAALRLQGWHITVNTTPKGRHVISADPNVDAWWLQDKDQVPSELLGSYWTRLGERFDKIVNLSESVEGGLLAMPGRIQHMWNDEARRAILNVNYMTRMNDIAGTSGAPNRAAFYPTDDEKAYALARRANLDAGKRAFVILWCLSGSSIHKVYPWTDRALRLLMQVPKIKIVFAGGPECEILEHGLAQIMLRAVEVSEEQSHTMSRGALMAMLDTVYGDGRIRFTSGAWDIRHTLAFAQVADMVIGPETGVLNAVAMAKVRKIVMLSHSTANNLTKDWVNTTVLAADPKRVPCYPCHRLHYTREFCPENVETGAAACASDIDPQLVLEAILRAFKASPAGIGWSAKIAVERPRSTPRLEATA